MTVQISLSFLRDLGFEKLHIQYIRVLDYINTIDFSALGETKPPYAFLDDPDVELYKGLTRFAVFCEPMYSMLDLSIESSETLALKRAFRNNWERLWKCFGDACKVSEVELERLSLIGLYLFRTLNLLPFEQYKYLGQFYTAVIQWYIATKYEKNLDSLGWTMQDALHHLVTDQDFARSVCGK